MKKLLSTITAVSLFAASTVGLSAQAFTPMRVFDGIMSIQVDESATAAPTATATATASTTPTSSPDAAKPTDKPTNQPTDKPTGKPTDKPTGKPTDKPTEKPTEAPTATVIPTEAPTATAETTPEPEKTMEPTELKAITLNKQQLNLKKGDSFELEVAADPADAALENILWQSGSECITVENGVIKAVSAGSAVVTAVDPKSKLTASCYVSVTDDDGTLNLNTTAGVKEVVVTKDGVSKEINAGANVLEAGTYEVNAKCEANYALKDYEKTVTIAKGQAVSLEISAEKTLCEVKIPDNVVGCTILPVEGSASPVVIDGSYSFKVVYASGMNTDEVVVSANGTELTPVNDVYTVSNIKEDITISIKGVEPISTDATLKSVTAGTHAAELGENNRYTVTIPYGETITTEDIKVVPNNARASYAVTTSDNIFIITVKAEDGTTIIYTLTITNAEQTKIDEFKADVAALRYSDETQSASGSYDSMSVVKNKIDKKVAEVAKKYEGMTYTIKDGNYEEPVMGTVQSPSGKNGYYNYVIELSDGTNTRTVDVRIIIYAYKFTVSAGSISYTATTITVRNLDDNVEVSLFTEAGARMRAWQTPSYGTVTFKNLTGGSTYSVRVRAQGSTEVPTEGKLVTTTKSASTGHSSYHTVTFDEGSHGTIVSGKTKQSVKTARAPEYPTVKADDGYIFVGWSRNGVLVEKPQDVQIRCATAFTAVYEKSTGSAYGTNVSTKPTTDTSLQSPSGPTVLVFNDVPSNAWFYKSVTNVCNKGYMNGVSDTRFEPNSTLTRAMLVTILYRYACEPSVDDAPGFSDVKSGMWYSDAVAWAADAGIVNGMDQYRFAPDENITREQLAAIMYRYSDAFGYDTSAAGNIIRFSDSAMISDWAQTALIWTTGAGIIDGKDNNLLDPSGKATRAEAATIIERFDNYING